MTIAKKLINSLKEEANVGKIPTPDSYMKLVGLFPLWPISSKKQHKAALKVAEKLISHISDIKYVDEGINNYLKTLSGIIADYEREIFITSATNASEMLAYLMELKGFTQKDLSKELGGQSVVSKVLKGERELNLRQLNALAKRFNISPKVFI